MEPNNQGRAGDKTVYISIGSNTPDCRTRVNDALTALRRIFGHIEAPAPYRTPCFRGMGEPYLNTVVRMTTDMTADRLDKLFKTMEQKAGRTYGPLRRIVVPLDIDVVVYDSVVVRQRDFERNYFTIGYNLLMNNPRDIKIEQFFYDLPNGRIAQHPLAERDTCKLLVCDHRGVKADDIFRNIGDYLPDDSLLVYNNTRVINARLRFTKPSGASIEIFCLEPVSPSDYQLNFGSTRPVQWKCLVGNSKRWKDGQLDMKLNISGKEVTLSAMRIDNAGAHSVVELSWNDDSLSFSEIIGAAGQIPIPPYLNRDTEEADSDDYQTVYSRIEGSVAAPTAGLHFTDSLLDALTSRGMERRHVTLHVGAGTFRPVKTETIGDHDMHAEYIDVDRDLIAEIAQTQRPITAVGTTTVRTLESLYHIGCAIHAGTWNGELDQWYPYSSGHPALPVRESMQAILDYLDKRGDSHLVAETKIIIAPGYRYKVVSNLVTNFHQPGSTLLLLVSAIIGETWKKVYKHALDNSYRFLSYGDACLIKDCMTPPDIDRTD